MPSNLITNPIKIVYPEQEQQKILNSDFMNNNITDHFNLQYTTEITETNHTNSAQQIYPGNLNSGKTRKRGFSYSASANPKNDYNIFVPSLSHFSTENRLGSV
jgi:hypothetical protein